MAFKVPAPVGHLKKNRFEFELGEETLSLPKLDYVPSSADEWMRDRDKGLTRTEFLLTFIDQVDAEVGAKIRAAKLTRDQIDALQQGWIDASEVTLGE